MIRSDLLGTTTIIRDLALNSRCYGSMNHFFRSSSWRLSDLKLKRFQLVASSPFIYKEDDYTLLVGDGIKQSKERKFMPGVKKLFQESENPQNQNIFLVICSAQ
jgi:hypothetical protein